MPEEICHQIQPVIHIIITMLERLTTRMSRRKPENLRDLPPYTIPHTRELRVSVPYSIVGSFLPGSLPSTTMDHSQSTVDCMVPQLRMLFTFLKCYKKAQKNMCLRPSVSQRAYNIYYLALYRKRDTDSFHIALEFSNGSFILGELI